MLSDHEDEGKVVHSERKVEQLVRVTEEDDVLDSVLGSLGVFRCGDRNRIRSVVDERNKAY